MSELLEKNVRWKFTSLGTICELLTDGSHTSPKPVRSNFYMASVKDMRYNHFEFLNCKTISKSDFDFLVKNNCSPKYGDILISKDGANCLDLIFVYKQKIEIVLLSSIAIARLKKGYNPDFYRYFLLSPNTQDELRNNFVSGSAIPRVILKDFKSVAVPLVNYPEQTAIAEVLSSLDDKIDLLHRQNKTLEQLAETIFRQWFVEQAEESWEEITFGKIVTPRKGKNITKSEAIEGEFPVVAGGLEPSCYHNEANTKAPVITVSASGANAGFVRLYHTPVWSSDSSYIDETITPYVYFSYVFLKVNQRQLTDKQEGSAQPHIYPSHIIELDCLNYPIALIEYFEKEVTPLFQKIKSNTQQIRTLTQLRDTLLPKLMSGEVRVAH
jgi:type I restriction enzyme, S subunit